MNGIQEQGPLQQNRLDSEEEGRGEVKERLVVTTAASSQTGVLVNIPKMLTTLSEGP